MKINIYKWKEIVGSLKEEILKRSEAEITDVKAIVEPIIDDIRQNGDDAVIKYAKKFDNATLTKNTIKATEKEFEDAEKRLEIDLKKAILKCLNNVKSHHEEQMQRVEKQWMQKVEPGVWAGEKITPINSVGLYVPRGKGCFPSVMYMLSVPAVVAEVPMISICTPPTQEGGVDDATLFIAKTLGIENVYKVGGAQAIATLACGTETIQKVDKVVGPGNAFVAAAKRMLSDKIDVGMPAGPSEALIFADETANPQNTALDMINEAEHGPDSASILLTDSEGFAKKVEPFLRKFISELPEMRRKFCETVFSKYGGIIIFDSKKDIVDFCNEYAVEHLILKVKNPNEILPKLKNCGEILIGELTPITLGNFGIGVNAILPTGGHAKTHSCTSVWDFLKRTSLAYVNKKGYDSIKDSVLKISDYEGFSGHSDVLRKRDTDNIILNNINL
ncbi:histidinol dehydrogenase [Pseudomonadota bacterium]